MWGGGEGGGWRESLRSGQQRLVGLGSCGKCLFLGNAIQRSSEDCYRVCYCVRKKMLAGICVRLGSGWTVCRPTLDSLCNLLALL